MCFFICWSNLIVPRWLHCGIGTDLNREGEGIPTAARSLVARCLRCRMVVCDVVLVSAVWRLSRKHRNHQEPRVLWSFFSSLIIIFVRSDQRVYYVLFCLWLLNWFGIFISVFFINLFSIFMLFWSVQSKVVIRWSAFLVTRVRFRLRLRVAALGGVGGRSGRRSRRVLEGGGRRGEGGPPRPPAGHVSP